MSDWIRTPQPPGRPPRPRQQPNGPRPQTGWQPQAWQPPSWQQPRPPQQFPPQQRPPQPQQYPPQQYPPQQRPAEPQWQQPPRPPGGPYPYAYQPPRKRRTGLVALAIVIPVVVVALAVVVLANTLGADNSPQAGANPQTTAYPSTQASVPQQTTAPHHTKPHTKPHSEPGNHPSTHSSPHQPSRPDLAKQHGYDEVPLPEVPDSVTTDRKIVADDNIYAESVSRHVCPDGPPIDRYPYPSLSAAQMQPWLQKIADCDQKFWAKPVAGAGFQATKVKVRMMQGSEMNTPCGTQYRGQFAAFYCSGNQQMYVDPTLGNPAEAHTYDWGQYWEVLSHEYGHSIQARTGILTAAYYLGAESTSTPSNDAKTRRIELQAQCFSGLAISRAGGMTTARFEQQVQFETTRTLPETHGSGAHQSAWFAQGHKYSRVFECDTFKAPSSELS